MIPSGFSSLIIKLPNWMGDILFSLDLLYSLSQHFLRIGLCTSSKHAELFQIFPVPNSEVIAYEQDTWPNLDRETILRIGRFDAEAGLLLPNSIGSALIFRYAGISRLYGYATEHRKFLLEQSLESPPVKLPQTEYYLNLLQLFGLPHVPYPGANSVPRRNLVILHPGASKRERAWHLDRFQAIAHHLSSIGFTVLFVTGEPVPVAPFEMYLNPSLTEFAGLLKECCLFIGNDSGPLHLAQQCGAPVIGIYGPGDPRLTGPRVMTPSRSIWHAFPCSPCRQRFFHECDPSAANKPYCIETIGVAEVIRAAEELLL